MAEQQHTLAQLRESLARIEAGTESEADTESGGGVGSGSESEAGEQQTEAAPAQTEEAYAKARAVVLRKLTGSAKSRHQLAEALREREFGEDVITTVLDRMEEVQLLDDAAFARTWVRTRHELKGLGSAALRRELQQRGLATDHIDTALEQLSAEDEEAAAEELIANKLRGVTVPVGNGPEDRKERDKLTRRLVDMLGRRGHHPGAAMRLAREALASRTH